MGADPGDWANAAAANHSKAPKNARPAPRTLVRTAQQVFPGNQMDWHAVRFLSGKLLFREVSTSSPALCGNGSFRPGCLAPDQSGSWIDIRLIAYQSAASGTCRFFLPRATLSAAPRGFPAGLFQSGHSSWPHGTLAGSNNGSCKPEAVFVRFSLLFSGIQRSFAGPPATPGPGSFRPSTCGSSGFCFPQPDRLYFAHGVTPAGEFPTHPRISGRNAEGARSP